jgi:hypothetical protein
MGSTGKGFRYPQYTDTPDVPRDLTRLAEDVDAYLDAHPGPKGDKGDKGDTGSTGAAGPANVLTLGTVTTGNAGSSVQITITGTSPSQTINFTIPRGDKGETGATGATGATGEQGPKGDTGATGPQGATGAQGTGVNILGSYSSLSALQAAHPTGSVGDAYLVVGVLYVWSTNTSVWLNVGTVQGPQGLKGDKGDTGETGPKGDKGNTGETGATGATGATGPSGANGQDLTAIFTISQKSTSYTLVSTDVGKLIEMSSGGTVTIPTDSEIFANGSTVEIIQTGSSQVTIIGDTGVTVNGTPGLKLRAQWSSATLIKRGNNLWVVTGDLSS